jgi:hypothetical protein
MKLLQSAICVLKGHKVDMACQTMLQESRSSKFETKCGRCEFPLLLERDKADDKSYFVTELDSLEKLTKSSEQAENSENS